LSRGADIPVRKNTILWDESIVGLIYFDQINEDQIKDIVVGIINQLSKGDGFFAEFNFRNSKSDKKLMMQEVELASGKKVFIVTVKNPDEVRDLIIDRWSNNFGGRVWYNQRFKVWYEKYKKGWLIHVSVRARTNIKGNDPIDRIKQLYSSLKKTLSFKPVYILFGNMTHLLPHSFNPDYIKDFIQENKVWWFAWRGDLSGEFSDYKIEKLDGYTILKVSSIE